MKLDPARAPLATDEGLDPELDAENAEFDFSDAPRPGRNELFERAQGAFHEVSDDEDRRRTAARRVHTPSR
jgi:hypothetical protein